MSEPRTVLVTGGNRGIGLACTQAFLADGHRVATVSRSGGEVEGALSVACDITDGAAVEAAIAQVEDELRPVAIWDNLVIVVRDFIIPVIKTLFQIWQTIWMNIGFILRTVWTGFIKPIFQGIWGFVRNTLGPIFSWFWNSIIKPVWGGIAAVIETAWNTARPIFEAMVSFIKDTLGPVWDGIKSAWESAWRALGNIMGTIWEGIKSTIRGIINSMIQSLENFLNSIVRGVNTIIRAVTALPVGPDIEELKEINLKVLTPDPGIGTGGGGALALQHGTDRFIGGMAILGERGREAALLPAGTKVFNADETNALLNGRQGEEVHFHYHSEPSPFDDRQFKEFSEQVMWDLRTGGRA